MERLYLKPADLIFVGGESLFSTVVKFFTRRKGEEPTLMHHVAGMSSRTVVHEALTTVKKSFFTEWKKKHSKYQIWRLKPLTEMQRVRIAGYVIDKEGEVYGAWKLLLHAMDGVLGKINGKENYFFRRILRSEKYPICSWLWAYGYFRKMSYTFGSLPNIVSPDDMHDFVKKSPDWECIYSNF